MGRFHADHNARHSLVNRHGSLVVCTFILVSSVSIDAADIISNRACRPLASSSRSNRRSFFPPFAARNVTKKSDRDYTPRGKRREYAHRIQSIDRFDYSIIETRRALERNRFAYRKMNVSKSRNTTTFTLYRTDTSYARLSTTVEISDSFAIFPRVNVHLLHRRRIKSFRALSLSLLSLFLFLSHSRQFRCRTGRS